MLCGISSRFQLLSPSERQVAHALLTRPPLSLPLLHPKNQRRSFVRLACVRHAASVRPEPGSNSLKYCIKTHLCASIYFRAQSLFSILTYHFFFRCIFCSFRNYCVRVLLSPKNLGFLFHRCLIFKVLSPPVRFPARDSFAILSQPLPFVKHFFQLFLFFFSPFFAFVYPPGCFCASRLKIHHILYSPRFFLLKRYIQISIINRGASPQDTSKRKTTAASAKRPSSLFLSVKAFSLILRKRTWLRKSGGSC